ncbi:MAG: ribosome recycling factor [Culturomica sp.]|jgi:ribosome recycling factor|nr:ribosome recycling factor [Culturomica sp.]
MNEEVKMYIDEAKEQMQSSIAHLDNELSKLRAGKANPKILNDVTVDYYGSPTPLAQVANIASPDPRTITVQPWEKSMLATIQKAILNSNLGFNPDNNGEVVRINIPPLTEERRRDLVKQAKTITETTRVSLRNARRDAIDELKKMVKNGLPEDVEKDAENEVQKITDSYNKKVDEVFAVKEKEIMTI